MTVSYSGGALMTRSELEEILAKHSGLAPHTFAGAEETPLEELGMESLAAMEIQAVITDQHGVVIPEDEIPGMSFNGLLAWVHAAQADHAEAVTVQRGGE